MPVTTSRSASGTYSVRPFCRKGRAFQAVSSNLPPTLIARSTTTLSAKDPTPPKHSILPRSFQHFKFRVNVQLITMPVSEVTTLAQSTSCTHVPLGKRYLLYALLAQYVPSAGRDVTNQESLLQ